MLSRLLLIALVFCATGILGLVGFVVWSSYGMIAGTEISPHTLQIRRFSYWQPWGVSKGLAKRETIDDAFSVALGLTGTAPTLTADRWDLVSDNSSSPWNRDLEARFLAEPLERRSASGEYYWVEWSTANVELAKLFWPLVCRVAVERFYLVIPELFAFAESASDLPPEEFESRLYEIVRRQLLELRADAAATSGADAEVQRLDQALLDFAQTTADESAP
ncbi:MAG: hypothetical protein JNL67_00355 [Planctomycetaceae bacterium]|nr:hypothetical protein [Planctomycetaceae bacterium]